MGHRAERRTVCCLTRAEEVGSKEKRTSTIMIERKRTMERARPGPREWVRSGRQVQEAAHMYAGGRDGGQEERDVREKVRQTGATGTSAQGTSGGWLYRIVWDESARLRKSDDDVVVVAPVAGDDGGCCPSGWVVVVVVVVQMRGELSTAFCWAGVEGRGRRPQARFIRLIRSRFKVGRRGRVSG